MGGNGGGHDADAGLGDQSAYYPTQDMPLAGSQPNTRRQFNELREAFLLGYAYNTARAYWSDLEQIADWADERGKDVLELSDAEMRQYVGLLRRRRYSEHTIRRRRVTYGLFRRVKN